MHYTRVSVYALMLAAAGIPLYIHLPQFASSNLGIGLGTIGLILLLIRLIDLGVTSRKVIWLFSEQLRVQLVPVLHRLQGRLAAQG